MNQNNQKTNTPTNEERTRIKTSALSKLEEQIKQQIEEITAANKDAILSLLQESLSTEDSMEDRIDSHILKIFEIICNHLNILTDNFTQEELHEVIQTIQKLNNKDVSRFVSFCLNRGIKAITHIQAALS